MKQAMSFVKEEVMSYIGLLPHPAERIDRGATWSDPEVDELLNIWTNENVQAELKEATIKKHIFERIARTLREKGFYRTAEQCREKIKRLKKEYRQAKNNNYRCVRGRATVKFFPRLQAVLDGRPNPKLFYDGTTEFGGGGDKGDERVPFGLHSSKSSPQSFAAADFGSEEIKVEVNPAEVGNDTYMNSETDAEVVVENAHLNRHPRAHLLAAHHHLHPHHLPAAHNHNHHHSIGGHPHSASLHHPITISIPRHSNNNGVLAARAKDEPESDASSGRATSPNAMTPAPNSPSSPQLRRKRLKRSRGFNTQALKDTLDLTLDRFLKHQRESEERLFAWEERRIQMELEAEERWRQEDREMLRQILTHLQQQAAPSNSQPSPSSGSHSNSSHDH